MVNHQPHIELDVDPTNPGQFFACCGLLDVANRLWPGAEGCFEDYRFRICCQGSQAQLIEAITEAELVQVGLVEDTASPIEIRLQERPMRLDWWLADRTTGTALKVWAGSMDSFRIARAMQHAMKDERFFSRQLFNVNLVAHEPERPEKTVEPYYFDARRAANSHCRDVGFAPSKLKVATRSYPAVEFFCLIGLQRSMPALTERRGLFDYFTWGRPILAELLAAVVPGAVRFPENRGYRFENWYRSGQKMQRAFRTAIPLSQGV